MNTYFWELVPEQIRYFLLAALPAPVLGFMASAKLHERFDKRPVIVVSVFILTLLSGAPVVLRLIGWMPENGSPMLLPILLVITTLDVTAGVILLISVMSTLADVADEHELNTYRRQEGIFYASRSFFSKAISGVGHLFAGIALDVIEFPVGVDPGAVAAHKVFELGIVDGPIAVVPGFIAVAFYMQFRLTRKKHQEIQHELAERHKHEQMRGVTIRT